MQGYSFGPETVDEEGCPRWITEIASENPNHLVHVVRDVEPARALALLGADPQSIRPCELPDERPDEWTSLAKAAIFPNAPETVLVAGRVEGWTFVYDDLGSTLFLWHLPERPPLNGTETLSAEGAVAATSHRDINGNSGFQYAVGGQTMVWAEALDEVRELGEEAPPEIQVAVGVAGASESDEDHGGNMRMICALAGLPFTMEELRRIPLLVGELDGR
jgi:hypothetical protein